MRACTVSQSWCLDGSRKRPDDPSFRMKNVPLTSSVCGGFQFCGRTQNYCYVYSLRRNQDSAPRLYYCLLTSSSLVSASTPFSDEKLSEPAFWNSGNVVEVEGNSPKTRNGGRRKACVSRSPTGPHSVSNAYIKIHQIVHLKLMYFILCKLHPKTVDFKS